MQKSVTANKAAQKDISALQGFSLNAVGSAFPELALIFLTSSNGKPTPALQQLALKQSLRDSLRQRDASIIDPQGTNSATEAAKGSPRAAPLPSPARSNESASVEHDRLLQALAVALQRENARAVLRRLGS